MDYKKTLIGALGTIANGTAFKRDDVINYLVGAGYASRTARNQMTPSRDGSMINFLLKTGAVDKFGPRGYKIVNQDVIADKPERAKGGTMKYYQGKPKDGWKPLGVMSDADKHSIDWLLCGNQYDDGCWNLKLYADGMVPHKANFWLQFKGGSLHGSDAAILRENHPDLYDNIISDVSELA